MSISQGIFLLFYTELERGGGGVEGSILELLHKDYHLL